MSKPIKTAIIPAAGFGTRMLPVTKVISKEMLPVGSKPIIDYVVDDLVTAGIERIVIVVKPGETQIKDYYSEENELRDYLARHGKSEKYESVELLPKKAEFIFVEQPQEGKYGTAIPLQVALQAVRANDPVLFTNGDELPWSANRSFVEDFLNGWKESGLQAGIVSKAIPKSEVTGYGVIEYEDNRFIRIVEKPTIAEAPSNLINISNTMVFPSSTLSIIENLKPDPVIGEYLVTDVLNELVEAGVYLHRLGDDFESLNVGSPEAFIKANATVSQEK